MHACLQACILASIHAGRWAGITSLVLGKDVFWGGRKGHMLVRLDLVVGRHTEGMGLF